MRSKVRLGVGLLLAGLAACGRPENRITLEGTVWAAAEAQVSVELTPLHYKYAPKRRIPVQPDANGHFQIEIPFEEADELAWFHSGDFSTPVLLRNGATLRLTQRSGMPETFDVNGYDRDWQVVFNAYAAEDARMMNAIRNERPNFKSGRVDETVQIQRTRVHLAKSHLSDSPFTWYIRRVTGEYLITRLKALEAVRPDPIQADSLRQVIFEEAEALNFFTLSSLRAQRAGIRDFTDAWSSTFGVKDSVEKQIGKPLMAYDIKRLGYGSLNPRRQWVVDRIRDADARAWSEMHLVLERLGEAPFAIAEASYETFKTSYQAYPAYTALAGELYADLKKVAPGSPAPDFSLPDSTGRLYTLQDFKGRYLLLDFWAQWCSPCLEEFPHMQRLYTEFNRNELEILAIGIDVDQSVWLESIRSHGNPWKQVYGGREFENELFKTYRGGGIPFYILIGPDGKIVRYNDVRPSFNLEAVLNAALDRNMAEMSRF